MTAILGGPLAAGPEAAPPAPAAGPGPAVSASETATRASGTTAGVSREVAEWVTGRLREALADADELQLSAFRGEVWHVLGYVDWQDYLASEFPRHATKLGDGLLSKLPTSIQRIAGARWRTVARFVRKEQERGLTALEFKLETGWDHGIVSSAFHQAEKKGVIRRVEEFRGGYTVYLTQP